MCVSPQLRNNRSLAWDYRLGLRGAGLILYGALPASLGALGAFKPPDQAKLPTAGLGEWLLLLIAATPLVLTFALIRRRLSNWYLLRDWLWLRSSVLTLGVVIASAAVCLATGTMTGLYQVVSLDTWWHLPLADKAAPFFGALLLSMAYLVGSSTLLLTVLKEDSNLPLLPGKTELENTLTLRDNLQAILADPLHNTRPPDDAGLSQRLEQIVSNIKGASEALQTLQRSPNGMARAQFYKDLGIDLNHLSAAIEDVAANYANWDLYWEPGKSGLSEQQESRRDSITALRGMRLGA